MKRFIDIGHQMYLDDTEPKQFAFYCTVTDKFERFDDNDVWDSVIDFKKDYLSSGGDEIERYISLIPDGFKKQIANV